MCLSSAVCYRQFPVPVLSDVRWRWSRCAHARRRSVDGVAREEIPTDEERQRGRPTMSTVIGPAALKLNKLNDDDDDDDDIWPL